MTNPALALLLAATALLLAATAWPGPQMRKPVCALGFVGTAAYLAWRAHSLAVLDLAAPGTQGWVVTCFVMEALFVVEFWVFLLLCSRYANHSAAADGHERRLRAMAAPPRVDVFVATCNEEYAIVEKSITAALALDYPDFAVHVLDDGRRDWLRALCAELGAAYVTRADNRDKKAGNHNHALGLTDAPLVAVFDADFVPFANFLWRTVGFFVEADVAVVQTPQAFYNKDSFQNNLGMQGVLADDQRLFFARMMPCRDAWGVAFYAGSSAVLRRSALDAIGGIVRGLDIEDQVTSVALMAKGYRTLYLDEHLSAGLAPESTFALIEQRKRWCRGCLQLLFMPFGPLGPDMRRLSQRLFYLPTYWLLGLLNPVFFLAECLGCWLTGQSPIVATDPLEILLGTSAVFAVFSAVLLWLGRGTWLPVVSSAVQLFLSFAVLPTALTTLVKPWGRPWLGILDVTPKGAQARAERVNWGALAPLATLLALLLGAVAASVFAPFAPHVNPGENVVLAAWTALSLLQLVVAAMVCFERPYRRGEERFALALAAELGAGPRRFPCTVRDLSLHAAALACPPDTPDPDTLYVLGEAIACRRLDRPSGPPVLTFVDLPPAQRRRLILALYATPRVVRRARVDSLRAMGALMRSVVTGVS